MGDAAQPTNDRGEGARRSRRRRGTLWAETLESGYTILLSPRKPPHHTTDHWNDKLRAPCPQSESSLALNDGEAGRVGRSFSGRKCSEPMLADEQIISALRPYAFFFFSLSHMRPNLLKASVPALTNV